MTAPAKGSRYAGMFTMTQAEAEAEARREAEREAEETRAQAEWRAECKARDQREAKERLLAKRAEQAEQRKVEAARAAEAKRVEALLMSPLSDEDAARELGKTAGEVDNLRFDLRQKLLDYDTDYEDLPWEVTTAFCELDPEAQRAGHPPMPTPKRARVTDADRAIRDARVVAAAIAAGKATHCTLAGPSGVGKTTLAHAIFAELRDTAPLTMIARAVFVDCRTDDLSRAEGATLLVLDDIGAEQGMLSGEALQRATIAIRRIVCDRHKARLPTICTTGHTTDQLSDVYGSDITRRLLDGVVIKWP